LVASNIQNLTLTPTIDTNFETQLVVKIKLMPIWIQIDSNISNPIPNVNNRDQFGNPISSKSKLINVSNPKT
jgi:hypothetical protein